MLNLTELKPQQAGIIAELQTGDQKVLNKLMAMGILPGMRLTLLQAYPAYVLQVGYTQVAVDKQIAQAILLQG